MATTTKKPRPKKALIQANQWQVDPRQSLFLAAFLDPKSDTFSNALQSGLKVGYSQEYSETITAQMPAWLSESLGDQSMLAKAERNLNEFLDLDITEEIITMIGPIKDPVTGEYLRKRVPKLMALKQDTSKFVAERLGRKRYGAKGETEAPPGTFVQNFTQINIHPPANGAASA